MTPGCYRISTHASTHIRLYTITQCCVVYARDAELSDLMNPQSPPTWTQMQLFLSGLWNALHTIFQCEGQQSRDCNSVRSHKLLHQTIHCFIIALMACLSTRAHTSKWSVHISAQPHTLLLRSDVPCTDDVCVISGIRRTSRLCTSSIPPCSSRLCWSSSNQSSGPFISNYWTVWSHAFSYNFTWLLMKWLFTCKLVCEQTVVMKLARIGLYVITSYVYIWVLMGLKREDYITFCITLRRITFWTHEHCMQQSLNSFRLFTHYSNIKTVTNICVNGAFNS